MKRDELITKIQNLINWAYKKDIPKKYYDGLFDEVEKLRQPISLAEFLDWEEGAEYEVLGDLFKTKNNHLLIWSTEYERFSPACFVSINNFDILRNEAKFKVMEYKKRA